MPHRTARSAALALAVFLACAHDARGEASVRGRHESSTPTDTRPRERAFEPALEFARLRELRSADRAALQTALRQDHARLLEHWNPLRAWLVSAHTTFDGADQHETALEIVGALGDAQDVGVLAQLAVAPLTNDVGTHDERRLDPAVVRAFEEQLARLLARVPLARPRIVQSYGQAHAGLCDAHLRVLAKANTRAALAELASLLGTVPKADPLVLVELGRLARRLRGPFDPAAVTRVRDLIESSDPVVATQSARLAALLRDEEAVPRLISVLRSFDPSLRAVARESLRDLTGVDLGDDVSEWDLWLASEREWWSRNAAVMRARLIAPDAAVAADTVRELLNHRLYPSEAARTLALGLRRGEPDVARMAATAIGVLGSEAALLELVEALEHEHAIVQRTALTSLRRLTGWNLEDDPEAWRGMLRYSSRRADVAEPASGRGTLPRLTR